MKENVLACHPIVCVRDSNPKGRRLAKRGFVFGASSLAQKYSPTLSTKGARQTITERYTYDRLGRVEAIYAQSGSSAETILAKYEYYPTGAVRSVELAGNVVLDYTYHISDALQNATAYTKSDGKKLYEERLSYEDCGSATCTPQYNGNISRMAHLLVHGNASSGNERNTQYSYDLLNRLTSVNDSEADDFDELFGYDSQGRILAQRRGQNVTNATGGEYAYYANTNRLEKVSAGMSDAVDAKRNMLLNENFIYDADGNLIEDKSKSMVIAYNHQGLPTLFTRVLDGGDMLRLQMAYDGSGNRITKRYERKASGEADWSLQLATHYTGIGSEIRESGLENATKVVVNLPQGFGRYAVENAESGNTNTVPSFEWVIKSHLGSTMLVYGTASNSVKAAYDYRAFGERVLIAQNTDKVTEEFTGKELDEETSLNYFGARMYDPMIGLWASVDPMRQFSSPYLYAGNGMNPVNGVDPDGNADLNSDLANQYLNSWGNDLDGSLDAAFSVAQDALVTGVAIGTAALGVTAALVAGPALVGATVTAVAANPMTVIRAGEFLNGAISGPGPSGGSLTEFVGQILGGLGIGKWLNNVLFKEPDSDLHLNK